MDYINSRRLRQIISVIALIGLSACSSESNPPDEGGIIIGTGVMLEGTTTSIKRFASNTVQVRSQSGERSIGTFSDQGRFIIEDPRVDGAV